MELDLGKLKVTVAPYVDKDGVVHELSQEDFFRLAAEAGWTGEFNQGKSIKWMGGEIFNPVQASLPIGYQPQDSIEVMIQAAIQKYKESQDNEADDFIDMEDFEVPDELPDLTTLYEFASMEVEAPAPKPAPEKSAKELMEDRVRAELEFEELKARQRRIRAAMNDPGPAGLVDGEGGQ